MVPVAGLAFGTSLDAPGPSSARPVSVVDALRRQAIRRSGVDVEMDLGNDEETSDDEVDAWEGTADEAGKNIVTWLRRKAGKATNYTVAVCRDKIYVTKVNGVTAATKLMGELKEHIEENGIEQSFNIYLCQRYQPSQPSNHAEMCVVAALGRSKLSSVTFFECTSPCCDYCAAFLAHYNVPNTSPGGKPASQAGWLHPFERLAFGTQLGDHATQVQELKDYLDDDETELVIGKTVSTSPQKNQYDHWL